MLYIEHVLAYSNAVHETNVLSVTNLSTLQDCYYIISEPQFLIVYLPGKGGLHYYSNALIEMLQTRLEKRL